MTIKVAGISCFLPVPLPSLWICYCATGVVAGMLERKNGDHVSLLHGRLGFKSQQESLWTGIIASPYQDAKLFVGEALEGNLGDYSTLESNTEF